MLNQVTFKKQLMKEKTTYWLKTLPIFRRQKKNRLNNQEKLISNIKI